ncbi:Winged helix DNA-binding protein [Glarea lozoyensis ATCC 20868]|uniref:Winged helix DNA-binding protein n=1 Tax=Glarea lozoyensis (strain ATCC 20868 / MF5171) TaxID=1116229 RepID=S3D6D0_GLAL2|nr:Winged helix DNA-binding protein [Glarea lozoyensis ATCC 20868]EPE34052.1 Winged helix DNA-binding protein [Glarea lozoyensis ATCC 20868]
MSSTRYSQQPLQIYQDPDASFDHAPMPSSKNAANHRKFSPLRPIKNAAPRRNIILNPPQNGPSRRSPSKGQHQSSSSPSRAPFGNKLNSVSMPPPRGPMYNTDSMEKKPPMMSKFKTAAPQKALFSTFSSVCEKENYPQQPFYTQQTYTGLPQSNFSLEGFYDSKPSQKRLMEAAPIHESRSIKKTRTGDKHVQSPTGEEAIESSELPAPDSFPALIDDGSKPPHSYAQLIGMSILRAPNRRLTLAQIYKWISDTYSFYGALDAGWQNSIRHNLSLNKAFIKQERPKDDPGKGNYWAIQPGMEYQFIKDKPTGRKSTGLVDSGPFTNRLHTPSLPPLPTPLLDYPQSAFFKPLAAAPQQELSASKATFTPESQLPTTKEPSSDATIPASDAYGEPEQDDSPPDDAPSSPLMRSSPPPAAIHSSPPVPRHATRRHDTPPPVPRFPSSSANRSSHKRKFASMDDSGYFSSLDSSALRPNRLLTSEADRPRIKRGRAEEEIARLRGSSYDSPTKRPTSFAPPSSSPLRQNPKKNSQMLPPLTPAVKLRAPARPPPSVSPNTNLRMHRDKVRELVGSPLRGVTSMDDNQLPWSPAFNLDDSNYLFTDFNNAGDFDIFNDSNNFLSVPGNGSPEKRSAKRPRLDRSRSANILSDISNHNMKNITSTPSIKLTPSGGLSFLDSPTKGRGLMESPSKLLNLSSPIKISSPNFNLDNFDMPSEDFFNDDFLTDNFDEFSGVDIMQGFQKIGAGGNSAKNTPRPNNRPPLGRSFTSRF